MKLALFTIAASLALSATAAVPFYASRDLDVAADVHVYLNTSTASNGTSPQHSAVPAEMPPADGQDIETAHKTPPSDPNPYQVHIRIGGPMQHVGTLRKYRLYWAIYNALKNSAEPRSGNLKDRLCNRKISLTGLCWAWDNIHNIVYNAQPHDTYANNAQLRLTPTWSEINEEFWPGLRHETYALIANTYRLMADDPSNCYEVNFPNSRRTTMCNVAKHMLFVINQINNDYPVPVVRVNIMLEFNGASTEGEFPCTTSLTPIADLWHDKAAANFAKVLKPNNTDYKLHVSCKEEKCFDIQENTYLYVEGNSWKQPEGCNITEEPWNFSCPPRRVC